MRVSPLKPFAAVLGAAILAGCATSPTPAPVVDRSPLRPPAAAVAPAPVEVPPGHYLIKKGDTLYSIALEHGHDYREVAAWNNLGDGSRITAGQVIRIVPPAGSAVEVTPVEEPVVIVQPIVTEAVVERKALEGNSDNLKREPKAGKEPYSDEALARARQAVQVVASVEVKPGARPDVKPDAPAAKPNDAKPNEVAIVGDISWAWPASGKMLSGFSESGGKGIDIAGKTGDPVTAAADGKVVYSGAGLRGYGQLVIVKHSEAFLTAYAHNSRILVKEGQTVTRGQKIAEMGSTDADQVKLHFEVRRQGKPVDPLKYLPGR